MNNTFNFPGAAEVERQNVIVAMMAMRDFDMRGLSRARGYQPMCRVLATLIGTPINPPKKQRHPE
jgi:hypothetical protein